MFGFFGRKKPALVVAQKRRRGRPTREEAVERRKTMIADAKAKLELAQLERQLQQISATGAEAGGEVDEIVATLRKLDRLKKAGILGADVGGDALDRLIAKLPDIVAGLGPVLSATQRPAQAALPPPALPSIPPPQPVQAETSWVVGYLKSQLTNRDPEQAAAWIHEQSHPFAIEMVQLIRTTPNSRVFAVLDEQARQVPEFAPLVDWLKHRGEWTLQVCGYLRQPVEAASGGTDGLIF